MNAQIEGRKPFAAPIVETIADFAGKAVHALEQEIPVFAPLAEAAVETISAHAASRHTPALAAPSCAEPKVSFHEVFGNLNALVEPKELKSVSYVVRELNMTFEEA